MKRGLPFFLLLLGLTALSLAMGHKQAKEKQSHGVDSAVTIAAKDSQGISGRVEIWEGNFMPMVDPAKAKSQIKPGAGRRVRAYLPVVGDGGMVTAHRDSIPTAMVAETVCDSAGAFSMATPPGWYSVYVEDNKGWYANGWNGANVQGAVNVIEGKTTAVVIKITTKATF
ncbi:MAG TPA: hypothetical protein VGL38_05630 [bacterium]|jgi:hypothetical protein